MADGSSNYFGRSLGMSDKGRHWLCEKACYTAEQWETQWPGVPTSDLVSPPAIWRRENKIIGKLSKLMWWKSDKNLGHVSARVTDIYIAAVVSGITLNGSLNQNKYYFDQGKNINIYICPVYRYTQYAIAICISMSRFRSRQCSRSALKGAVIIT